MFGYRNVMKFGVRRLNPRIKTHRLDDFEQILFHISASICNVGLTIMPAPQGSGFCF